MTSILTRTGNWFDNQVDVVRDFYSLDYWSNHALSEGFAEAMDGWSESAEISLEGRSSFTRASAGAGMGLAGLIAGIPIMMSEWGTQVVQEIPKGPGATLYRFFEVPVMGISEGVFHISHSLNGWFHGSLNSKSQFEIAREVTGVLGGAALLAYGARQISRGARKFMGGLGSVQVYIPQAGHAAAVVSQGAITLAGGADILGGTLMMAGSEGVGNGEKGNQKGPDQTERGKSRAEREAREHAANIDRFTHGRAFPQGPMHDWVGERSSPPSAGTWKETLRAIDKKALVQRYGGKMLEAQIESARLGPKNREAALNMRIPATEKEAITKISAEQGMTVTQFTRIALHMLREIFEGRKGTPIL